MNESTVTRRAPLWRRVAARTIDAVVVATLVFLLMFFVAGLAAWFVTGSDIGWSSQNDEGELIDVWILLMILASFPVVRYEVASTARRGQTFGKRCVGIQVVPCRPERSVLRWRHVGRGLMGAPLATSNDQPDPISGLRRLEDYGSLVRWAVPHGTGLVIGVAAGVVWAQQRGSYGALVGAGAGLAAWAVVYASSLLDANGRGWHDRAAGTAVVAAPDPPEQQQRE